MNNEETLDFAERLMREVWLPLDPEPVDRFYRRDVVGYNRQQRLSYDDVVHRLVTDRPRFADPHYDIQDIIAAEDKFAIRFAFTAKLASGQPVSAEANYFYHLREGKISAFWLLADIDFDYRAES
ncbi:MAG TPA: ester cyclase [Casimicrobiaceae bacterium]|jgi:predicted ester cyclase